MDLHLLSRLLDLDQLFHFFKTSTLFESLLELGLPNSSSLRSLHPTALQVYVHYTISILNGLFYLILKFVQYVTVDL